MSLELTGPSSHIYISQRLRLHYVDWGNPAAPPLILIHGNQDHCRNWDWIAQELRHDWHIIAPDLRGHGDSAWSPDGQYSFEAYVCDIAQLINQKKLGPATIVGHSMGGNISARYSSVYPENVKKLVCIEGIFPNIADALACENMSYRQTMREWVGVRQSMSARQPRRYATINDAFQRMRDENPHLTEAQARHLTYHGASQNEDGTYSWKFDNYTRKHNRLESGETEVREIYSNIECPTFLAWGTETFVEDPEESGRMSYFQDAFIKRYPGASHWVHHDKLDDFLRDLKDFID